MFCGQIADKEFIALVGRKGHIDVFGRTFFDIGYFEGGFYALPIFGELAAAVAFGVAHIGVFVIAELDAENGRTFAFDLSLNRDRIAGHSGEGLAVIKFGTPLALNI